MSSSRWSSVTGSANASMSDTTRQITVCMGSSCFARGNNRNIEVILEFLRRRGLEGSVQVQGHLCGGICGHGPNLVIEGREFQAVQPAAVEGILARHFGEVPANG